MYAWLEAGGDVRAFHQPFGGYQGEGPDPRNDVRNGEFPRRVSARGFAGVPIFKAFWLGLSGEAGYGADEDDLSRPVLGGMNPYSVTIPGAAWSEWRSERYAVGHAHFGVLPRPNLYVGLSGHLAVLND